MTNSPTPAERDAIREGYSALIREKSPTSHIVETIVFAFGRAGRLVPAGGTDELAMLRGVIGVVRAIVRHGELAESEGVRELRRVIAEYDADERAAHAEREEKDTRKGESTPRETPEALHASSGAAIVTPLLVTDADDQEDES